MNRLDNCNFAEETVWNRSGPQGKTYKYHSGAEPGYQFISEASSIPMIGDETYEVVLSSHVLEHIANPLKALLEWKRILRVNGFMLLLVPHKAGTFDHKRPLTSFEHIEKDYKHDVTEADLTHLDEILKLHDLSLDRPAGTWDQFRERSLKNVENRCLHHHVFSSDLLIQMLDYLNLKVVHIAVEIPHIIVLCEKIKINTLDIESVHTANQLQHIPHKRGTLNPVYCEDWRESHKQWVSPSMMCRALKKQNLTRKKRRYGVASAAPNECKI